MKNTVRAETGDESPLEKENKSPDRRRRSNTAHLADADRLAKESLTLVEEQD